MGCGCGSVGRAAASDTRDPRFEPCHPQNLIYLFIIEKTKMKKKRLGMIHLLKIICNIDSMTGPTSQKLPISNSNPTWFGKLRWWSIVIKRNYCTANLPLVRSSIKWVWHKTQPPGSQGGPPPSWRRRGSCTSRRRRPRRAASPGFRSGRRHGHGGWGQHSKKFNPSEIFFEFLEYQERRLSQGQRIEHLRDVIRQV